ncbi:MAG: LPS assembly protein LptD [Myxococcales bacterium]
MPAAALLALVAALGQLPAPQLVEPGDTIRLRADLAEVDTAESRLQAEGHVLLESGGLRLFSSELDYDLKSRDGSAGGGLLLFDGTLVVQAREGRFSLEDGGALSLEDAELWQKAPSALGALQAVTDAATAKRTGRNLLLLRAEHLDRVKKGRFLAQKLRMTPCDCGEASRPDWSLSANEADIEPGERAILWWPTLRILDVPVFILPALYLPLSNRRTGLLFPRPGYHAQSGFFVDEPFFWAIDESHDLTITLGWRFGNEQHLNKEGTSYERVGAQGPRGALELRYVPAEHTFGRLFFSAGYDLHGDPEPYTALLRPARGWRGELAWRHSTEVAGFGARADLNLVSDAWYRNDQVVDVLNEAPPYLRSQAWLGYRGSLASVVLSGAWYQDMQPLSFTQPERWFFGPEAPAGYERPLALDVSLPRTSLVGPLRAGLEAHAARVQTLSVLAGAVPANALALNRLDLAPMLSLPLQAGSVVNAELYAGARGDSASYSEWGVSRTALSGRAFAGAWAGTQLSRTFEGGLRHTIEPSLELRAATQRMGDLAVPDPDKFVTPRDEFDERRDGFVQGVGSLTTRLVRPAGELARLDLGQDVDLGKGRAADSFARLVLNPPYSQLTSVARWDWQRRAFSAVAADLRLFDSRGDSLQLRYERLLETGTGRTRTMLDALFGLTRYAAEGAEFNQVFFGLTIAIYQGIAARYSAVLVPDMPASFERRIILHTGGLTLTTSCDCWRVDGYVSYVNSAGLSFGFLVDLKSFGSFGR